MIIYIIIPLVVIGGCFAYARSARKSAVQNYDEKNEERLKVEQEYGKKVRDIAKTVQPDLSGKTIINGQYIKSVKLGVQVITYYSYLIILDTDRQNLQVISYLADTKEAQDCGFFTKEQVVPINLYDGAQTNYQFLDEDSKEKFVVQTVAVPPTGTYNSDYELQYPQLDAYTKLRHFFGLSTDSKLIQTGVRS